MPSLSDGILKPARSEPPGKTRLRAALAAASHTALPRVQGYRTGDLLHKTLGDEYMECNQCAGTGIDPEAVQKSETLFKPGPCAKCDGRGGWWQERMGETS